MSRASAPATAVPLSFGGWVRSTTTAGTQGVASLANSASSVDSFRCILTGSKFRCAIGGGGGFSFVDASANYTVNTWQHMLCVWSSATDRYVWMDGGSKGDGTGGTSRTPAGINSMSLGRLGGSSPGSYLDGQLAEWGLWDVALTDADALMLAAGFSPLCVRPGNLIGYWPIIGRYSPEIDVVGGNGLTVTGATVADHPRIIYDLASSGVYVPTSAGTAYDETGLGFNVLAQSGETDLQAMSELGRAQTLLALSGVTDAQAMQELARAQVLLAQSGGSDLAAWSELARAQTILALTGETDLQAMSELGRAQIILALTGETDALGGPLVIGNVGRAYGDATVRAAYGGNVSRRAYGDSGSRGGGRA
jgi:hypothetical protein